MSHTSDDAVERVTLPTLQRWKEKGRRLVMTTAYDAITADQATDRTAIARLS